MPKSLQSTSDPQTPHRADNTGAISGGVVGGAVCLVAAVLLYIFWRKHRQRTQQRNALGSEIGPLELDGRVRRHEKEAKSYYGTDGVGKPVEIDGTRRHELDGG